jgi:hypothetical protein
MAIPDAAVDLSLTPEEADLSAAALDAFAVALGGRHAILDALQVATGSPEIDKVAHLLLDPRYGGWSLRRLCTLAGLTIADFFAAYKKSLLVKAHLQAAKIVTDELVHVVEDVMKRAHPYKETCTGCRGVTLALAQPCTVCGGTGQIQILPDLDRQKLALELGQLVSKSGGINLTQNTQVVAGTGGTFGPGAIDQLQQAVAAVLTPRARRQSAVIDVVPVVGEEAGMAGLAGADAAGGHG